MELNRRTSKKCKTTRVTKEEKVLINLITRINDNDDVDNEIRSNEGKRDKREKTCLMN